MIGGSSEEGSEDPRGQGITAALGPSRAVGCSWSSLPQSGGFAFIRKGGVLMA